MVNLYLLNIMCKLFLRDDLIDDLIVISDAREQNMEDNVLTTLQFAQILCGLSRLFEKLNHKLK